MKKVHAVYFSGTGTTKKMVNHIADKLVQMLNLPKEEFDFSILENRKFEKVFTNEDLVVFGVPVIAGRVPNVLLKIFRHNKRKWSISSAYSIIWKQKL